MELDVFGKQKLEDAKKLYLHAFDRSAAGKMFVTDDGIISVVNLTIVREAGYFTRSQLIGEHINKLLPEIQMTTSGNEMTHEQHATLIRDWFPNPYPLKLGKRSGFKMLCNRDNRPNWIPDQRQVVVAIEAYEPDPSEQMQLDIIEPSKVYGFVEILFLDSFEKPEVGGCPV